MNKIPKQETKFLQENRERITDLAGELNTDKEFIASAIIEIGLNHLEREEDEFLALYKAYMVNGKESKAKNRLLTV
jgi:hypothetical protein